MRDLIRLVEQMEQPFEVRFRRNPDFPMKSVANWVAEATRDGDVIALAEVSHDRSDGLRLETIWVRKDMRRQGIATMLFRAVEKHFAQPMKHSHRLSQDGESFARSFGPVEHEFERIKFGGSYDRRYRPK